MSRNGSGTYSLPSGNPVVPSTVISSTWANNTLSDIATALTQSIANDGQTAPVANLPMATFRHTNVGNAVNRTDYAAAGQVQDSSLQWLTSVAGTNTITASITPSPGAYVAGQAFRFVAAGANTGATTLNINGLGAKNITKRGTTALVANDIVASAVYEVIYDGTQFQLSSVPAGMLINVQRFTANGTYTPTPGTNSIIVELVGGGGQAGGAAAPAGGQISIGGGGAAGGYSKGRFTSGFTPTVSVTVGAGGSTGISGAAGQAGSATSFGALITANGGGGGFVGGPGAAAAGVGGNGAAVGTGGNILQLVGANGQTAFSRFSDTNSLSGFGASTIFGAGAPATLTGTSANGTAASANSFGAGGGGGASFGASGTAIGGAGSGGIVIIYEYS